MRMVIALGGNALLRRGEPITPESQRAGIRTAAKALATIHAGNELVITHGNGPQVGLLALQGAAYGEAAAFPLDVLGSQTEGMIGYVIEQELGNLLPREVPFATLLTLVEVDGSDPAFQDPRKFIGPVYTEREAHELIAEKGWSIRQDGNKWRRVVASPEPQRVFEIRPIRWLLEKGAIVICAGGGGIPCVYDENHKLHGIEAVIDKDLASEHLARELEADLLIVATDVEAVFIGWNTEHQRAIKRASPAHLRAYDFPAGSMGPKVEAACRFAELSSKSAVIGAVGDLGAMVDGRRGTTITTKQSEIEWY